MGKVPLNKGPGVVWGHVHVDKHWPGLEIGRGMPTWADCHDKSKMLGCLSSLKSQLYVQLYLRGWQAGISLNRFVGVAFIYRSFTWSILSGNRGKCQRPISLSQSNRQVSKYGYSEESWEPGLTAGRFFAKDHINIVVSSPLQNRW